MADVMDPVFAAGLRRALVEATAPRRRWARGGRRWIVGGAALLVVVGTGAAAAQLLALPGGEVATNVAGAVEATGTGNGALRLGAAPADAEGVSFDFDCLSAGNFVIGSMGTTVRCTAADIDAGTSHTSGKLRLEELTDGEITVRTIPGARWTMSAAYVSLEPVPLATNANGETYGTDAFGADPDLIAAIATNGSAGYIRREDLDAATGADPSTPEEALARQEAHESGTTTIPVYELDGVTAIGEFRIGG
ncbi:hypothetical protein [Demequina soli]|uniref:hypothetical protein n=1 Tax=Demequina soli TaxID=1638987 RepID=UPI0007855484|nr:hypothetical protein [Demequina soli]